MDVDTTLTESVETIAAPAISEPSATPAVSERPKTAQEAWSQIAAKEDAVDSAKATAAITPAGTAVTPSAEPKPAGVPPEERWPSILENQRKEAWNQAIQARDQQWQEKAGWVMQLPPERQAAIQNIARDLYAHPPSFVMELIKQLQGHPQYGQQMAALLGTLNGNGNGHAPVSDEPQPDVEIIVNPQTGQTVRSYSADQQAKREAWLSKQYDQRFEQRLAPFEEARRAEKDRADRAEFDRQATASVNQSTARILKILDERTDLVGHVNTLIDSGMHWLDAAIQVREQHLKPQQAQQATATAADTMRRKAAGNTANGSGAPVTPMARPKTEKELAAYMEQLDRG